MKILRKGITLINNNNNNLEYFQIYGINLLKVMGL